MAGPPPPPTPRGPRYPRGKTRPPAPARRHGRRAGAPEGPTGRGAGRRAAGAVRAVAPVGRRLPAQAAAVGRLLVHGGPAVGAGAAARGQRQGARAGERRSREVPVPKPGRLPPGSPQTRHPFRTRSGAQGAHSPPGGPGRLRPPEGRSCSPPPAPGWRLTCDPPGPVREAGLGKAEGAAYHFRNVSPWQAL